MSEFMRWLDANRLLYTRLLRANGLIFSDASIDGVKGPLAPLLATQALNTLKVVFQYDDRWVFFLLFHDILGSVTLS